jgi:3-methyladenine DNA glycosylase Tag
MQSVDKRYAVNFVHGIKDSLIARSVDYEKIIESYGQVTACVRRDAGYSFKTQEHIRALIVSQLNSVCHWHTISSNVNKIQRIFFSYDPDKLKVADWHELADQITEIGCVNRIIEKQLAVLSDNIEVLLRLQREYGSIDNFITYENPYETAVKLSMKKPFKLKQVGYSIAVEYLRNVGVKAIKHDKNIRVALGHERLALSSDYPAEEETIHILTQIARLTETNIIYIDSLLWLFCSKSYGAVCISKPRCSSCELSDYCCFTGHA